MRILLTILLLTAFLAPKAQTHLLPAWGWGYTPVQPFVPFSLLTNPDGRTRGSASPGWQLRPFASVSAGYAFLGAGVSYLSAPVGLVLTRPLNDRFTAFGAATVAPTVFHVSSLYPSPLDGPGYPGNNLTRLGLNAGVSGGLIYTNEAKTFSVSGSISVQRGSYPVYTAPGTTLKKQN